MARSVNEIQHIGFTLVGVLHLYSVALDGDALFPLQIHIVQHLIFHLSCTQCLGKFNEPVGKGTLSVVYMSNYAEIPYVFHL